MSYRIIFHPEAEIELLESIRWYEQALLGLGVDFFKAVEKIIHHLSLHPYVYAKRKKTLRKQLSENFHT